MSRDLFSINEVDMITWINKGGKEVVTNETQASIKAAVSAGWTRKQDFEIPPETETKKEETLPKPKPKPKPKKRGR